MMRSAKQPGFDNSQAARPIEASESARMTANNDKCQAQEVKPIKNANLARLSIARTQKKCSLNPPTWKEY